MEINFEYTPLPVHADFHKSTTPIRVLFGAYGSGKSYAVLAEAIAWCLEQPGIVGAVARKTVAQLRDAEEPIVLSLIPDDLLPQCVIKKGGGHIERIVFPNGSNMLFRSLDDPVKWRSLNLGFIAIDEANEIGEDGFNEIYSRVRQRDIAPEARKAGYSHEITRRGVWAGTNPSGHDWLWKMSAAESPTRRSDAAMFTSTTLDNPFLPTSYVEGLLQMPKPYIKRYVLCQFDDFAGTIYDDWTYETHVVKDLEPDRGRLFWMGMDPGTRNPTAGLWVWHDASANRLVGVADYEEAGLAAEVHAKEWRQIEARHHMNVRWRVADPNAITQRDRGTVISLQTQYAKLGFQFQLGASKEQDRIMALGRLIHLRQFVVTESCLRTFEAIQRYQWQDLTPSQRAHGVDGPDKVLKVGTHLVECAQFLCGRKIGTGNIEPPKFEPRNAAEQLAQSVHKDMRRRREQRSMGSNDLGGMLI